MDFPSGLHVRGPVAEEPLPPASGTEGCQCDPHRYGATRGDEKEGTDPHHRLQLTGWQPVPTSSETPYF